MFLIWLSIVAIVFFYKGVMRHPRKLIQKKIKKMNGEIITIEESESFLDEIPEFDRKSIRILRNVYKILWKADNTQKILYLVKYQRKQFPGGETFDWVEKT